MLTKDSRLPSPTASGRGTEGSPRENWDLTLITTPYCTPTPKGKGGNSCRGLSRTFHFPVDRNQARATPTSFPRQNPATDTGTSSGAKAAEPRVSQTRSPESTERGRKQETLREAGGGKNGP